MASRLSGNGIRTCRTGEGHPSRPGADLPPLGVRVQATTWGGRTVVAFRRKMPRGGWVWATDYPQMHHPQDAFVSWSPVKLLMEE